MKWLLPVCVTTLWTRKLTGQNTTPLTFHSKGSMFSTSPISVSLRTSTATVGDPVTPGGAAGNFTTQAGVLSSAQPTLSKSYNSMWQD